MQEDFELMINKIPWDFDPDDDDSIDENWNKLSVFREAALATPLRAGIEFSVNLECPTVERERPILSLARTKEPCRLVLRTPLQTGVDRWSQVWIVSVHSSSSEPTTLLSETAELAVVKIVQPSMLKLLHSDFPGDIYEYTPPLQVATRENLIYQLLEKAQGSAIPYYYGMTQPTMPNGEVAWMHIIEYIPGKSSDQVISDAKHGHDLLSPDEEAQRTSYLKEIFISTLRSLREIHGQGVYHGDVNQPKNIILYERPDSRPTVVFIDFTSSMVVELAERRNIAMRTEVDVAVMGLCCCCWQHMLYLEGLKLPDGLIYESIRLA